MKILMLISLCTIAEASSVNTVSKFFAASERQLEAKSQCQEIKLALNDMLKEEPSILRQKRYKDYQGKIDRWTITELLSKYYLSSDGIPKEREFFRDYRKKLAKTAIKSQLTQLGDCSSYAGD